MMKWERFFRLTAVLLFAATVMVGFQVQWAEARGFRGGVHGFPPRLPPSTTISVEAATSFSDLV
jgi:hypothetical protein